VSQISRAADLENDFWRFTADSCSALLNPLFGKENVTLRSYGNVLACIGFLSGMAHEELSAQELNEHDEHFPLIVAVRAVKR
jgi:hypothetical protein